MTDQWREVAVGVTGTEREGSEGLRDCGCRCGCVYTRACVNAGRAKLGERDGSERLRNCGSGCADLYT